VLGVEVGEELLSYGAEESFHFAATFRLIGTRVHNQSAEGGGNARQLGRAIYLSIVHVETNGYSAGRDGVAQTVERGIESLAGIKLGMGNESAGVIESGVQKDLHAAAIVHPPDPGAKQHVGLPDLIAEFGLKLLVRRRCEQLFF
jgi:hypothetical protein